jgi:hypothetical protein
MMQRMLRDPTRQRIRRRLDELWLFTEAAFCEAVVAALVSRRK